MRLNLAYFKSKHPARAHQNEKKVPFRETQPLVLKNYVLGGAKRSLEGKCLFEMTLLLGCWKENNYDNNLCMKQIQNLNTCYQNFMRIAAEEKKLRKIEVPSPTTKSYTSKQITYMLRMYPTV